MKKHKLIIILVGVGVVGAITFGTWYSLSSVFNNNGGSSFGSSSILKSLGFNDTPSNLSPNTEGQDGPTKSKPNSNSKDKQSSNFNNNVGSNLIQEYKNAKAKSPYVAGWIYVEGTDINYPVMAGRSSEFWLTHGWDGNASIDGSIFLGDGLLSVDNNVILINGHNMANGSMFANLLMFSREGDFFSNTQNHRIFIYDGSKMHVYQVFSVFFVNPDYQIPVGPQTKEALSGFAQDAQSRCISKAYNYNGGNLLYLNTCNVEGQGKHQILVAEEIG